MSRKRGTLNRDQINELGFARKAVEQEQARYRRAVLRVLSEGGSFAEVSKVTGLSTSTLQRWKREAR